MPLTLGYGAIVWAAIHVSRRRTATPKVIRQFLVAATLTCAALGGLAVLGLTGNLLVAVLLILAYAVFTTAFMVIRGILGGKHGGTSTTP